MEKKAAIYNITVNGEQRKAIDLESLKGFLVESKLRYSILNLDPESIQKEESIMEYLSKAAINVLIELEETVDKALGLVKEPEPEFIPEEKQEPEEPKEDLSKVDTPEVLKDEQKPEQKVDESEKSDEIVI